MTNPERPATDEAMKDKWLQVRVDNEIEQKLAELRKAESDLPGKSEMVIRLINAAHTKLKKKG